MTPCEGELPVPTLKGFDMILSMVVMTPRLQREESFIAVLTQGVTLGWNGERLRRWSLSIEFLLLV